MSVSGTAITTALSALKLYSRRVDRSAEQVAATGLIDFPTDPGDSAGMPGRPATSGEGVDLTDAMTSMLIAQRAFSAQLRVLRTADEMLKESVEVVGGK
jgi:Flagellar basal body rod FlgEFG protein C-terminal